MADNISLSASLGLGSSFGQGKVRAMFHARRTTASSSSSHSSPVGWDKSYPLNPISRSVTGSCGGSTASSSSSITARGGSRRKQRTCKNVPRSRSEHRLPPATANSQHPSRSRSQGPCRSKSRTGRKPADRSQGPRRSSSRTGRKPADLHHVAAPKPLQQKQQQKHNDKAAPNKKEMTDAGRQKMINKMKQRDRELLDKIKRSEQRQPAKLQSAAPKNNSSRKLQSKKQPAVTVNTSRPPLVKSDPARRSEDRKILSSARSRSSARSYRSSASKENQQPIPRPPPTDPNMAQCPYCTRHFAVERLETHKEICEKSTSKKRKQFDPIKMRVQGTESEKFLRKIKQADTVLEMPRQDWRKEHEEFVTTIRAAKEAQSHLAAGGKLQDLPPPPPSDNSHYIECPHCKRRFNAAAAERHIPKCAAIVSNKPAVVAAKRRR